MSVLPGSQPLECHPMKSNVVPGLDLNCEVRDRDCRVGGFNFQWARATDSMAGRAVSANVRTVSGVHR